MTVCETHLDPKSWDLTGSMEMVVLTADGGEPIPMVHVDKPFTVRVTVTLRGRIRHYLCGSICVELGFESTGSGCEFNIHQDKDLVPCGDGVYVFSIVIPANTLEPGHCGRLYDVGVTLGSFDACGHPGFIFGTCGDFDITALPALED